MQAGQGEITPDKIKAMLEGFAAYSVTKEIIEKNIQRRLDSITPALLARLRKIYTSLKDQMSVAADWFEMPAAPTNGDAGTPKTQAETVKDKLRGQTAGTPPGNETMTPAANATTSPKSQGSAKEPYYSKASAIDAIKATANDAALQALWKAITADYSDSQRELPVEVEAAYNEHGEALDANL